METRAAEGGGRRLWLRNRMVHLRRRLGLDRRDTSGLAWLFLATLPNSGSTAFANLLGSAPHAAKLHRRGEGQWLVPELSAPARRWNPDAPVDFALVRSVWLDRALSLGPGPRLVVEKSPPNICRLRPLVAAFADMPIRVVRFTRDPYAVCASWAKRYDPARMAEVWGETLAEPEDATGFHRRLGDICGRRMALLAGLADVSDADVAYEALADDPAAVLARLVTAVPLLAGADPAAVVKVKDYAPQPLRNMNREQIARLTPAEKAAITEGLRPHAAAIKALGYALDDEPVEA